MALIAVGGVRNAHAILAGRVSSLQGDVTVTRLGELNARSVAPMMEIHVNDQIMTGSDGRIRILFTDDSVVSLAENSKLRISKQVYNPAARQRESVIDLFRGRVRSVVSRFLNTQINRFEIRTPTAVAGVRGSEIITEHDDQTNQTTATMIAGQGYMQGHGGENFTNLNAGTQGTGTGTSGFSTTQLSNSELQNQQGGFETDQSGNTTPQTNNGGGGSGGSSDGSSGDGSSGTGGTGDTGTGGGSGSGSDSGPLTNTTTTTGAGDDGTSGQTGGGTGTDGSGSTNTLTDNDLQNNNGAPISTPIQLEPPPSFSNVRAVITLH